MKKILVILALLLSTSSLASKNSEVINTCNKLINFNSLGGAALFEKCIESGKSSPFINSCGVVARMVNKWDGGLLFSECLDLDADLELVEACIKPLPSIRIMNRPRFFLSCVD